MRHPQAAKRALAAKAPGIAVTLAGATVVAAVTISHKSRGDRQRRRAPYRAFMATQYAAHAAVLLTAGLTLLLSRSGPG